MQTTGRAMMQRRRRRLHLWRFERFEMTRRRGLDIPCIPSLPSRPMSPSQRSPRLTRVYLERAVVELLEVEAAHLSGVLGRLLQKSAVYSAVIAVGLGHRDEVVAALRAD